MKVSKKLVYILVFVLLISNCLSTVYATNSDISNHWAEKEVTYFLQKQIISGYPDGSFRPDNSITRVEFYKIINGLLGFVDKGVVNYNDVNKLDWFYPEVEKGIAAKYLSGYGNLYPNKNILRNEVARIIGTVFDLDVNPSYANIFSDSSAMNLEDKGYIGALANEGYISGYPDGSFRPFGEITRAEVVKILSNISGEIINLRTFKNMLVNLPYPEIKNSIIDGNLFITEGINSTDILIDNVTVKGTTSINTNVDTLTIKNSRLNKIVFKENISINSLIVDSKNIDLNLVGNIELIKANEDVVINGIKVNSEKEAKLVDGKIIFITSSKASDKVDRIIKETVIYKPSPSKKIINVKDIKETTEINSSYELPDRVVAYFDDGSWKNVDVIWNPEKSDTSKASIYTYEGTVADYSEKIKLTLTVVDSESNDSFSYLNVDRPRYAPFYGVVNGVIANETYEDIWGSEVLIGASVELSAIPDYGYRFVSWKNNLDEVLSTENPYSFSMPEYDIELFPLFERIPVGIPSVEDVMVRDRYGEYLVNGILSSSYGFIENDSDIPEGNSVFEWIRLGIGYNEIYSNVNDSKIYSGPEESLIFQLEENTFISKIETIHDYFGYGSRQGEITIIDSQGVLLGSWRATGSNENRIWTINPNILLGAGEYKIECSNNETWSYNEDAGFTRIYSNDFEYIDGETTSSYKITSDDIGSMIAFGITPVDQVGNIGKIAYSNFSKVIKANDNYFFGTVNDVYRSEIELNLASGKMEFYEVNFNTEIFIEESEEEIDIDDIEIGSLVRVLVNRDEEIEELVLLETIEDLQLESIDFADANEEYILVDGYEITLNENSIYFISDSSGLSKGVDIDTILEKYELSYGGKVYYNEKYNVVIFSNLSIKEEFIENSVVKITDIYEYRRGFILTCENPDGEEMEYEVNNNANINSDVLQDGDVIIIHYYKDSPESILDFDILLEDNSSIYEVVNLDGSMITLKDSNEEEILYTISRTASIFGDIDLEEDITIYLNDDGEIDVIDVK